MKKYLLVFSFVLLLFGCASPISKFNVSKFPEEQLATVRGTENDLKISWGLSEKIFSRIAWVYDKTGKLVIDRGWENTWGFTEIKLEPGFYIFVVYCGQGKFYATPHVSEKVESSKEYIASCENGGNSSETKGTATAHIYEVKSAGSKN